MENVLEVATADNLVYQFFPVSSGSVQFKVKAPHDAHISLTQGPQDSNPMYEVFIGGWVNTKSVIRKDKTQPDKETVETPDILSANEFRGFWIRWDNGIISAGREGEAIPFLSWADPEPIQINFIGVCTGWGASGSWKIEDDAVFDTPDNLEYRFRQCEAGSLAFEYRGPHNCHVILNNQPGEINPMYEFIIGGWENKTSVIRYNREQPDKVSVPTPGIVDANEFRRFLIEWRCGRLLVRDAPGNVIMEWVDPAPFPVRYFGVRTGWGAHGQWRIPHYPNTTPPPSAPAALAGYPGQGAPTAYPGQGAGYPGQAPAGAGLWADASGGAVPPGAIQGGQDCSGEPLFVARAQHLGALLPGKLVPSHGCAYVAWGGQEHGKPEYQVLVGGPSNWVPTSGSNVPPGAFLGGETEEGEPLFVGRVRHEGSVTTGKVQQSHGVCYIAFAGQELGFPDYEVLVG